MTDIRIRHIDGGYIITYNKDRKKILPTLEEVFEDLLHHFEGRGKYFGGNSFGIVEVIREPSNKYPEVEPA